MHNEKQNESFSWINKLDDPACLPAEEMIEKNAAWKKLHERLREKPRRNRIIWYWAAAACLLIACSFSLLISKRNEDRLVKNGSQKNKKEPQAIARSYSAIKKADRKIENAVAIEKKENNPVLRKHINSVAPGENALVKQTLPDDVYIANATEQQIINTDHSADTISSVIASVVPAKRKMQVVHINEIENAEMGVALSKPEHQQSAFGISLGNNNQSIKQATSSTRDYAGVFKIKISSKN